ncbi:MAG: hypothetical protein KAH18_03100, partial [Psychromonas sp.]|nr:hypothetical protein [Psychromonas sp.]
MYYRRFIFTSHNLVRVYKGFCGGVYVHISEIQHYNRGDYLKDPVLIIDIKILKTLGAVDLC